MRPISDAEQRIIICMSSNYHPQEIAMYTGVSKHTIKGIISHFQQTGDIKTSNTKRPSLGNRLNSDDVQVFHSIIYSYFWSNLDPFIVLVEYDPRVSWSLSWWAAIGSWANSREDCVNPDSLLNSQEGWYYLEEGVLMPPPLKWPLLIASSLHALHWKEMLCVGQSFQFALVNIIQSNLFSVTKVPLTAEQPIEAMDSH